MSYIVGAYAAAPVQTSWDPAVEAGYLAAVAELPGLRGLEVPYTGKLHHDEDWLLDHLDPGWDLVLTAIPGTVARTAADPHFGLASPDATGRQAALDFTAGLRTAVRRIHDRLGRAAVIGVELHSAPRGTGTAEAFADTLTEVCAWDWDGAALTIEHCDALRPGQDPQKGYLDLDAELKVVAQVDGLAGITVNWGRSAIEGRSADTAREHIAAVAAAGALTGLMFSGAAARPGAFGDAWLDAHLPPSGGADVHGSEGYAGLDAYEPTSLLGPTEIRQALAAAAGRQLFTGLKVGVRPTDAPLPRRIAYLRAALALLDHAAAN